MPIELNLVLTGEPIKFLARRLVAAGYTGRNQDHVRAHIEELERQGIPAPESFPTLYEIELSLLTTRNEITTSSATVSGEAEAVLLFITDRLEDALVSVGSDFTDRVEERRSIQRSKQQPKPINTEVWRFREVAAVWDDIAVRSWVEQGAGKPFYQSGKLSQLLAPPVLLEHLGSKLTSGRAGELAGTIMLMGTVPLCDGEFRYAPYFGCELETPAGLKLAYSCAVKHPR